MLYILAHLGPWSVRKVLAWGRRYGCKASDNCIRANRPIDKLILEVNWSYDDSHWATEKIANNKLECAKWVVVRKVWYNISSLLKWIRLVAGST